jgi:Tfp pilus assembly protein FimT
MTELITVMTIIAIMLCIVTPALCSAMAKGRDTCETMNKRTNYLNRVIDYWTDTEPEIQ